jgi:hypothetical protein
MLWAYTGMYVHVNTVILTLNSQDTPCVVYLVTMSCLPSAEVG